MLLEYNNMVLILWGFLYVYHDSDERLRVFAILFYGRDFISVYCVLFPTLVNRPPLRWWQNNFETTKITKTKASKDNQIKHYCINKKTGILPVLNKHIMHQSIHSSTQLQPPVHIYIFFIPLSWCLDDRAGEHCRPATQRPHRWWMGLFYLLFDSSTRSVTRFLHECMRVLMFPQPPEQHLAMDQPHRHTFTQRTPWPRVISLCLHLACTHKMAIRTSESKRSLLREDYITVVKATAFHIRENKRANTKNGKIPFNTIVFWMMPLYLP